MMLLKHSKQTMVWAILAMACLINPLSGMAAVIDVSGVKYEDAIDQRGNKLMLNGAGIRYKAVFKVYTAGLYLQKKASTMEEVLAMPGSKRITLTMLREVDSNELGKLFTRGVEDNTPKSEMGKLIPGLIKMGQIFSEQKKLAVGDTIMVEWVPRVGGVIFAKGKPQGEPFKEPEFYNALLRIWLGPVPADYKLKEALLGRTN